MRITDLLMKAATAWLSATTFALLAPGAIAADSNTAPEIIIPEGSEIQVFAENDFLDGTDRYYTNGFKLGFGTPVDTLKRFLTEPSHWVLDRISDIGGDIHFGLFMGQNMYTPRSIRVRAPQPFDRPWSAWLYLGGVAQRVQENTLDTVELDIGMVGPLALGKDVQTHWHRLVGVQRPLGWNNQLPNEPAFLVSYLHKRKFGNDTIEVIPHGGATLGTVMTLARAGGIVRIGHNMTGFGPDSIEPGGAMLQTTRREYEAGIRNTVEWYGFVGADYRLVARNIFLDGTVFHDSASVDRRPYVHDLSAGLSARYRWLRISLTHIRRSEEFTTPHGGGGRQNFDSLNLGFEF